MDVAKENMRGALVGTGQLGAEFREDVEFGCQRAPVVHTPGVDALPIEGLAPGPLQTLQVDIPALQYRFVFRSEIVANDGYQTYVGKVTRRQGDIRARTAEHAVDFPARGLYAVVGNRTNYQQ